MILRPCIFYDSVIFIKWCCNILGQIFHISLESHNTIKYEVFIQKQTAAAKYRLHHSLVPRRLRRGRNAWYTLFAHALISKPISKNLWKIGYSGNLPCNSDVTSLKSQVAFSIMASTTFQGSTFSDAVSYALKQLQMSMSVLNPSSDHLWRPYMTGMMFSCGCLCHCWYTWFS